jgi:peptide/nickel transport system permease protein
MGTYITRRLIMALAVLILVTIFVFLCMRLLPSDPIQLMLTSTQQASYTDEQLAFFKHEAGLDRPLPVQYISWVNGVLHGDLGTSLISHLPVSREILHRIPITLNLGLLAFVIGIVLGIPAGILCAVRRGTWVDTVITTLANIGITVPTFWIGVMLIYFFGLYLGWLPIQGYASPFENPWLNIQGLVMPVFCLALYPIAGMARQTRSSMLETMRQDYIRTAWSKGLRENVIVIRHALKNGIIPVVTLLGMNLSMILGGSVIVEQVFNIPGIGRLAIQSINNQDYPYIQGIILIITVCILLVNLATDLTYGYLDPRIRYS